MDKISPLSDKSTLYIENSICITGLIKDTTRRSNYAVSLRVINLFFRVPNDEEISVVQEKHVTDIRLKEHAIISEIWAGTQ